MNFSNKIKQLTSSPRFTNPNQVSLGNMISVHLPKLDIVVEVYFKTVKHEELMVEMANYHTEYQGQYLGVIDGFFSQIQNRPIEAIDRFPIKELDMFLRDDVKTSAFAGYSQEIYEILSIGESIKSKIFGDKKLGFQYDPKKDGLFFDLSTSEQFELMEELFAYHINGQGFPEDLELIDVESDELIFNIYDERLEDIIKAKLFLDKEIQFKFEDR